MKVAFICDLPKDHFPFWNDGLRAALRFLEEKHEWEIDIHNVQDSYSPATVAIRIDPSKYDVGIFWGALTNPMCRYRAFGKQVLCFAGGPTYSPEIHNFDLILAESQHDLKDFKRFGVNVVQAFGTNTDLFKPMPEQPKIYQYVYPAAFAKWKHHEKFAEYVKIDPNVYKPSLAFGYMQPSGWEKECYEVCQKASIAVMPQVPYEVMPYILTAAEFVYVGADYMGGCQRTILEAKACDIEVVVDSDSPKLLELKDLSHEEVVSGWDHKTYAKEIKKAIETIL